MLGVPLGQVATGFGTGLSFYSPPPPQPISIVLGLARHSPYAPQRQAIASYAQQYQWLGI